jgi:hypothetical protein
VIPLAAFVAAECLVEALRTLGPFHSQPEPARAAAYVIAWCGAFGGLLAASGGLTLLFDWRQRGRVGPAPRTDWSWPAFLLTWIWGIRNNVWSSLLVFFPVIGLFWALVLGAKGNQWAWEYRHWSGAEQFERSQKRWTAAAIIASPVALYALLYFNLWARP